MGFIKHRGNFDKTERFLNRAAKINVEAVLRSYGEKGILALSQATPVDSGETAHSWTYKIIIHQKGYQLIWINTHMVDGAPVAILLQYGHGTRNGTYVQGRDYINPAMKPILDSLSQELWKEVTRL